MPAPPRCLRPPGLADRTRAAAGERVRAPDIAADRRARAQVLSHYRRKLGRWPDLEAAPRFTELVQQRKLYDHDPRHPLLMEKLWAKAFAARTLGPQWAIPTLWDGPSLPDAPPFAFPVILKARHGCNQNRILRQPPAPREWHALQALAAEWVSAPYGQAVAEWGYLNTERGLLAEPLIGDGTAPPVDYKIYVFGGRATHVQVHLGRGGNHRWVLHDRDYRPLAAVADRPPPPVSLPAMLDAAEALGAGYDFLRIDFYEVDGQPLFGEFCLYPGSGFDRFAEDWIDLALGKLWHAAGGVPRRR